MNLPVTNPDGQERAEHLIACARSFLGASRPVPSHIIAELWRLRSCWKGRDDVPAVVMAACEVMERQAPRTAQD